MSNQRVDVAVVGGGPAGATAALRLARAGFAVLLLDRASFPRAKACGDCISPQANLILQELGLRPALEQARPAQLRGWRIHGPSGASFKAEFSDQSQDPRLSTSCSVERSVFDAMLLEAARQAGVDVREHTRVQRVIFDRDRACGVEARNAVTTTIQARLVIGADGLRSIVRRQIGAAARAPRLRKVAFSAHLPDIAGLTDLGEMHIADGACAGLAPVAAHGQLANLTLVLDSNRFGHELRGKRPARLRAQLDRFAALRDRVPSAAFNQASWLSSGPFDWPTRHVVIDGAALVGDAAGYYDPFTGQGIYQALRGAQLLAEAAVPCLRQNRTHALYDYQHALALMLRGARVVQHGIEFICARPRLADHCIRALQLAPLAAQRLLAVTGDLAPAASLLSPPPLLSFLKASLLQAARENG